MLYQGDGLHNLLEIKDGILTKKRFANNHDNSKVFGSRCFHSVLGNALISKVNMNHSKVGDHAHPH
jgi:hypothetical protein